MRVVLDELFELGEISYNFVLYEKVETDYFNKELKKRVKGEKIVESYFGTLHQCLQAYLRKSMDQASDINSLKQTVEDAFSRLLELENEIKDKFRTEVLVTR